MHFATGGNNYILRTPQAHIIRFEEILPHSLIAHFPNQNKLITPPQINIHKVDTKSHPSSLFPLCNTRIYNTHHFFNCTHIRTTLSPQDLWTDPRSDCTASQMDGEAGWWTTRGNIGPSPTSKGHGVGRQ